MKPSLRVAFVGMKRPPSDMPDGYWPTFVQYHMELPYYYAKYANCAVTVVTTKTVSHSESFDSGGSLQCITEDEYRLNLANEFDVTVHWRKWFDEFYDPATKNVILSQDHSYTDEWKTSVKSAVDAKYLHGILVFPTWHKENTARELAQNSISCKLIEGLTLGVDTDTYQPISKDPYHLLWASDPGRGLETLINPFLRLWQMDKRYRLTVTYPDYVKHESVTRFSSFFNHPGVKHLQGVRNGPQLWSLFNSAGILPYSSTFPEPSSRAHRQAMAAGCLVLYPPNMGSPSQLIENGLTGVIEDPMLWPDVIHNLVTTGRWAEFGHNARTFALSENWAVQAKRFHTFFSEKT